MNEKLLYKGTLVCCALTLILLITEVLLVTSNRKAQAELERHKQAITQGQTLNQLNQGLVRVMAEAALKNNNMQLRALLSSQGITLKTEPLPD